MAACHGLEQQGHLPSVVAVSWEAMVVCATPIDLDLHFGFLAPNQTYASCHYDMYILSSKS